MSESISPGWQLYRLFCSEIWLHVREYELCVGESPEPTIVETSRSKGDRVDRGRIRISSQVSPLMGSYPLVKESGLIKIVILTGKTLVKTDSGLSRLQPAQLI